MTINTTDEHDIDESVEYQTSLRSGGWLVLTAVELVVMDGDEPVRVKLENVVEVTIESIDWFLVVLSLTLIGFGFYATTRNVLGGLTFTAIGAASLYLTYRKRDRIRIRVHNRPKPITVYSEDADAFYAAMERTLDQVEQHDNAQDSKP